MAGDGILLRWHALLFLLVVLFLIDGPNNTALLKDDLKKLGDTMNKYYEDGDDRTFTTKVFIKFVSAHIFVIDFLTIQYDEKGDGVFTVPGQTKVWGILHRIRFPSPAAARD